MDPRYWIVIGGVLAALGVAAGAFGAHGLRGKLERENKLALEQATPGESTAESTGAGPAEVVARNQRRLETFEVAVRYQMYHAVGVVLVGLIGLHARGPWLNVAGWLFVAGIVIFSGMLYGWVLLQIRALAMIVPIGGVAFILGWLALAAAGLGRSQ